MGRKVFVSYKYGDTQVQDLKVQKLNLFGNFVKVQTKARHYVNELAKILDSEDHIYKGEDDGESLADFSDEYIASALRDKIYDSSITIVLVSKGMKTYEAEMDQWIPWEISYSLREYTRDGRKSLSNGILAVVLPDENGNYSYFLNNDSVCNCTNYITRFLFQILRDNMFNKKESDTYVCSNGSIIHRGEFSYIKAIKWEEFKSDPNYYLNKAIELRDKKDEYNITKSVK